MKRPAALPVAGVRSLSVRLGYGAIVVVGTLAWRISRVFVWYVGRALFGQVSSCRRSHRGGFEGLCGNEFAGGVPMRGCHGGKGDRENQKFSRYQKGSE